MRCVLVAIFVLATIGMAQSNNCDSTAEGVECSADADEAAFLQLDTAKRQKVTTESVQGQTLKTGALYTGHLKHPSFPNQDIAIRMDLTSATGGLWRDVEDKIEDEQKFTVSHEGERIKLFDSETKLDGMIDAVGVVRGEFIHEGVGGGSFVLMPEASSDDEAGFLQLGIAKRQQVAADSVDDDEDDDDDDDDDGTVADSVKFR